MDHCLFHRSVFAGMNGCTHALVWELVQGQEPVDESRKMIHAFNSLFRSFLLFTTEAGDLLFQKAGDLYNTVDKQVDSSVFR